jgi:hypothetical protein
MELRIFSLKVLIFSSNTKESGQNTKSSGEELTFRCLPTGKPRGRIFPSGTLAQPVATGPRCRCDHD